MIQSRSIAGRILIKESFPAQVPVIVDSVKKISGFKMTRVSYFSIESVEPSLGWHLILTEKNLVLPFLMLNLSGIIVSPLHGGPVFGSVDEIEDLFSLVEDGSDGTLFIDINDLWLPNQVFPKEALRGEVYRLPQELFLAAMKFRKGIMEKRKFSSFAREHRGQIATSPDETGVFREWTKREIELAKEKYQENKKYQLKRRESTGR